VRRPVDNAWASPAFPEQRPVDGASALTLTGVSKFYGATAALVDVSLELHAGEVHCLLGENGAGKSTLVKIIAGLEQHDRGSLRIDGEEIGARGVKASRAAGVGIVYQHPIVFPEISVTENIYAGRQIRYTGLPFVDNRTMRERVRALFKRMDIRIDPNARMAELSTGERQLVEIAKALSEDIRVLILDEPTAALPDKDVGSLFSIVRRMADLGVAILFISHRLDEVFEIGTRVTVLRDGHKVGTEAVSDITKARLIEMMVGRQIEDVAQRKPHLNDLALEVRGWSRRGVFADVSFSVRRGEVLGFAGLVGSGGSDVARTLFAVESHDEGEIRIEGTRVDPRTPRQMMNLGLALVPEDRLGAGLIPDWSVLRNITLPILPDMSALHCFPRPAAEAALADRFVSELDIRPPRASERLGNLSGGNQQKVLLSKWLASSPRILILEEPTAGIDIGAKTEIHRLIGRLAENGMALIVVSSDLSELLSIT
jgi:rhamnose transport system ATP-binding protein